MCSYKLFAVLFVLLTSCTTTDVPTFTEFDKQKVSFNINRVSKSFVYLESSLQITQETCNDDGECSYRSESVQSALGSGATITYKGKPYVITAGHVCLPQAYDPYLLAMSWLGTTKNDVYGHGYFGNVSKFTILTINIEKDVCILKPDTRWVSPRLKLAKKLPKQGSKVFMVSAPFGIFQPGMVLAYDGYLAGMDEEGDILVSVPTKPGTSGSAILDKHEKVIGIVHSAFSKMENIGIGTPVDVVHELFKELDKP